MICGSGSLVYDDGHSGVAVTLRCRSWRCPDCQPLRRMLVIDQARSGNPTRFITLTVNPSAFADPVERAERLARAWRIVVKRFKRAFAPKEFEYLAVFEATKRGEPHLHILLRGPFIDQRWLSDQMKELIDAPIVDVRRVQNQKHLMWYMAKYMGKDLHKFGTCKRYWRTKNYVVEANTEIKNPWQGCNWKRVQENLEDIQVRWMIKEARPVYRLSAHCIVAGSRWEWLAEERTRAPPPGLC